MQPQTRRAAAAVLAFVISTTASACRPLHIETEPGPAYMVDIRNTFGEPMIVQFDDGRGPRLLGTVGPGAIERFIIAVSDGPNVMIIATNESGSRQVRRDVFLQPGVAANVVLS